MHCSGVRIVTCDMFVIRFPFQTGWTQCTFWNVWEMGSVLGPHFSKRKLLHNSERLVALVLCFARHPNALLVVGGLPSVCSPSLSERSAAAQCTSVHSSVRCRICKVLLWLERVSEQRVRWIVLLLPRGFRLIVNRAGVPTTVCLYWHNLLLLNLVSMSCKI